MIPLKVLIFYSVFNSQSFHCCIIRLLVRGYSCECNFGPPGYNAHLFFLNTMKFGGEIFFSKLGHRVTFFTYLLQHYCD